jgi:alpha-1,2-mannosyltransferase
MTMVLGCTLTISLFVVMPQRLTEAVDFPAFYIAGRIINEYPRGTLYDQELQRALYVKLAPEKAAHTNLFFVYTPFFALIFSPLALMPYGPAFVCWILISLTLFTAGFRLAWAAASLPMRYRETGFVLALAFVPFYFLSLLSGQTSAFGFFWVSLAVFFDHRNRRFVSGCALAMLLYKPTLLLLLVPMLLLTKRWRTIGGFCLGAVILSFVSFVIIGGSGLHLYFGMLSTFSRSKAMGLHPIWYDVDAFSFFLQITHGQVLLAWGLLLCLAMTVLPFLVNVWIRRPERAWAHTITWTLILNLYVLIYDSTLIILAVLLSIEFERSSQAGLPRAMRWLLLMLFLVPWGARQMAANYAFQPMTVALVAFGCYQLWRASGKRSQQHNAAATSV